MASETGSVLQRFARFFSKAQPAVVAVAKAPAETEDADGGSEEDVRKLVDFVLFVGTLVIICKRMFNILETVVRINPTSRSFEEIMRGQSLQFIRLMNELRELKLTPVGRYIFQMIATVRDVKTLSWMEKNRLQKTLFSEFANSQCAMVNNSETFDRLVIAVVQLMHHLSNFHQNGDIHDLFAFDHRQISTSYMWRYLSDLNGHVNDEVMKTLFRGLDYDSLEVDDLVETIRDEMSPYV